jgi:phage baseplate assembly protein W
MSTQLPPTADPGKSSAPTVDLPHFAFPFVRGKNGHVNVLEQDTIEHVMSCEQVIATCPLGARQERPEFGWDWPVWDTWPLNLGGLEAALQTFEPRGIVSDITELANAVGSWVRDVNVDIQIRSET